MSTKGDFVKMPTCHICGRVCIVDKHNGEIICPEYHEKLPDIETMTDSRHAYENNYHGPDWM